MEIINGALGEGGGQIFRSALTLAMCLQKEVRIKNIRAGRKKPGLLRQHLTCLRAAQKISNAEVEGDYLGSQDVTFKPGKVKSGLYQFSIGSAGSTSLVFQTIYLPLLIADGESEVYLEGGTHNGMSPSYEFIDKCFRPVMKKIGCEFDCFIERYGFFPAGGGAWIARIKHVKPHALQLTELVGDFDVSALAISANIPEHVNERELRKVSELIECSNDQLESKIVKSRGPGNILSLTLKSDEIVEVFDEYGETGVRSERIAERAVVQLKRFVDAGVPVGEYLADQLILPMALGAGGVFRNLDPKSAFINQYRGG